MSPSLGGIIDAKEVPHHLQFISFTNEDVKTLHLRVTTWFAQNNAVKDSRNLVNSITWRMKWIQKIWAPERNRHMNTQGLSTAFYLPIPTITLKPTPAFLF